MTDSLFRSTARGREPLASASDAGEHVHYEPSRRVGIGSITSKKPSSPTPLTFFEYLAIRAGLTLAEAKRLYEEGKIR
jgi:hypothetical protein